MGCPKGLEKRSLDEDSQPESSCQGMWIDWGAMTMIQRKSQGRDTDFGYKWNKFSIPSNESLRVLNSQLEEEEKNTQVASHIQERKESPQEEETENFSMKSLSLL